MDRGGGGGSVACPVVSFGSVFKVVTGCAAAAGCFNSKSLVGHRLYKCSLHFY